MWNLTEYRRVLYFDPDVFWTGDASRYLARYGHAPRLAVAEYFGANKPLWWEQRKLRYINSGILVLRPSLAEHAALLSRLARGDFVPAEPSRAGSPGLAGRSKMSEQDVIRSHFEGVWTAMPECENFRGYVKRGGGQAHCEVGAVIAWHGARLRGLAAAQCQASKPPQLAPSFRAWLGQRAATPTRTGIQQHSGGYK